MPIARARGEEPDGLPGARGEGDNAVGELAEGHGVKGRGVDPVDDQRAVAADPFEAFARRAFRGCLGGMQLSAACSISSPLKADTNPAGLISCTVRVWQFAHGQWFPIMGVARWDEFAPIKVVWIDNQPTDRKVLDKSGRWADVPFLMLAECAEAQAIRKGWPEDLSNTFVRRSGKQATRSIPPAR